MEKSLKPSFSILLLIIALISNERTGAEKYHKTLTPNALGLGKEKLSHLHFFFHDVLTGKNPTCVRVAEAATTNASATKFGVAFVMDDALTVGPDPRSARVGRDQGFYASSSMSELALLMVHNFVFTAGKFNGSTLAVLGRDAVSDGVREFPVVGGSGVFRFARGYALLNKHILNPTTGDAISEYNVYVFHY